MWDGIWMGMALPAWQEGVRAPTYLYGHGSPLDPGRAGDEDFVGDGSVLGEQRVPVLRLRMSPVDVQLHLLTLGGGLQGKDGEELAPEARGEVLQGSQVFVHDVLRRQLAGADRVSLETLHKLLEDVFHAEFGQVVVLLDLAVEGTWDAVLEAAEGRNNPSQQDLTGRRQQKAQAEERQPISPSPKTASDSLPVSRTERKEGEKPEETLQTSAEQKVSGPEAEKPSSHLYFLATSSREMPFLMAMCER